MAWFATNIIGIIPIVRGGHAAGANPLEPCERALDRGEILIIFPEGSRGEPEKLQQFKKGVAHLAKARPADAGASALHARARQGAAQGHRS